MSFLAGLFATFNWYSATCLHCALSYTIVSVRQHMASSTREFIFSLRTKDEEPCSETLLFVPEGETAFEIVKSQVRDAVKTLEASHAPQGVRLFAIRDGRFLSYTVSAIAAAVVGQDDNEDVVRTTTRM